MPGDAGEDIELREPSEDEGEDGEGGSLTLSPAVRRVVLEHHLDPSKIKGTGKDGRLTKDDVLAAAKAQKAQPAPAPAPRPRPRRLRRRARRAAPPPASAARSGCG